jgi:hypothetical protein
MPPRELWLGDGDEGFVLAPHAVPSDRLKLVRLDGRRVFVRTGAALGLGLLGVSAAMSDLKDPVELEQERLMLMRSYLMASAEREPEPEEQPKEGGTGTRAKGEESGMGSRFALHGPKDSPDPHIARQAALREATEFGMIGLLHPRRERFLGG